VEPASTDLDRRHHRRELLDVSDEAPRRGLDLVAGDRHGRLIDDVPGGVERGGGDPERDGPAVLLALFLQEAQQSGGATQADEQDAGGVGIQRAGVTDPALAVHLAHAGDDVVRRPAGRFVDDDETVNRGHGGLRYCGARRRAYVRRRRRSGRRS
jgi:hypothetical protein